MAIKEGKIQEKVPFAVKLGYSVGSFGEQMAYNLFYLFYMLFLTTVAGIDPAVAGTISLVAILWDAVTDPLVGYWSDNLKNPNGRRRPFLLRFCIPLGAAIVLLFTSWQWMSGTVQVIYFFIMNMLFWFFFTLVDVPYISLGGELTESTSEKTSVRAIATMFNTAGFIAVAAVAVPMIGFLADKEKFSGKKSMMDPVAWSKFTLFVGLVIVLCFLVTYFATKGREPKNVVKQNPERDKFYFFREYVSTLKIRPFRPLILFTVVSMIGGYMLTGLVMHFFIFNLGASEEQISILMLTYGLIMIALCPLVSYMANKFGKKAVLIATNCGNVLLFFIFSVVGINLTTAYFLAFGMSLFGASFFTLAFAATYDVADLDMVMNGRMKSRQGVIYAFFAFMMKAGTGLGMFIAGIILKVTGFDESLVEQNTQALKGIHYGMTLLPALFFLLAVLILLKYPIKRNTMAVVEKIVKAREEGKDYSTEELGIIW